MVAVRDGKKPPNPAPFSYQVFQWRKEMKIGYFEAMVTPAEVVIRDLEFMDYQQRYGEKQPESNRKNKKGLANNGSSK